MAKKEIQKIIVIGSNSFSAGSLIDLLLVKNANLRANLICDSAQIIFVHTVKLCGVAAENGLAVFNREAGKGLGKIIGGVRPSALWMRKVATPHDLLQANLLLEIEVSSGHAGSTDATVTGKILTGGHGEMRPKVSQLR